MPTFDGRSQSCPKSMTLGLAVSGDEHPQVARVGTKADLVGNKSSGGHLTASAFCIHVNLS